MDYVSWNKLCATPISLTDSGKLENAMIRNAHVFETVNFSLLSLFEQTGALFDIFFMNAEFSKKGGSVHSQ